MRDRLHLEEFQGFHCTSCGLCCRRPWGVRIEPEVEAAIQGSQTVAELQRQGYVPIAVDPVRSVNTAARQPDGSCIFLAAGELCSLHSELGERGKPVGCQTYPYRAVRTPTGVYFSQSWVCPPVVSGLDRNVEENRQQLQQLLELFPQAAAELPDQPYPVRVAAERWIGWRSYLKLEEHLLQAYDRERPSESLLSLAWQLLRQLPRLEPDGAPWLDPLAAAQESAFENALVTLYARGALSVLESGDDPERRSTVHEALLGNGSTRSLFLDGPLPVFALEPSSDPGLLEAFFRYYRNTVVGKNLLVPSLVRQLLALAVAFRLLDYYFEAFSDQTAGPESFLESLTRAFEIVESELFHSDALAPLFADFEATVGELVASQEPDDDAPG